MVRVRNLVLAIAAATALTSEMAYALGLGEVTLKSALNQPLVAEIELLDAKTLAPGEVVPVLASADDFNRAGVDRQYFLTDLTFTPVLRPDGKSVIRVSSTKPVREPYLNFLIEVLWPNGRLLREYTLLLDPPLYSPEIAASVAPQLPIAAPIVRSETAPRVATRPAPAPTSASALQGEHKVTPNDTLWEIAERARQGGTVHQTMLAIQDLNPDAFIAGNINRMKNGQVLRLPNAEQIGSRSQAEAIQQVAQQNASWRQAAASGATGTRQLDATQRDSVGAAPSRSEQGDNLRLVAPEADEATAGSDTGNGADAQALRDKLAVTEESLDSSRRENLDLKDRLNDLQGQLDKLQRLMQLKDDQLAKLQAQLATGAEPGVDATSALPSSGETDSNSNVAQESPEVVTETTAEPEVAGTEVVAPAATQGEADTEPAAQAPVTPAPATSAPAVQEPEADSYVDELLANPILLGALGGGALLLLLVGLMALSRRNALKEAELQESLLADSSPDTFYMAQQDLDSSAVESTEKDSGEHSADSLAAATNDPLAEADIYIAYGRFNQAADLLQNALNDEPQRSDLRLKLMEVYAELGDRDGFARQEAELREIGGSLDAIEQTKLRYPAMAAATGFAAATAATSANDFESFSLDDLQLDEPASAPTADQVSDDAFDLSLDDLELDDELARTAVTPAGETSEELDELNFDDLNLEAAAQEQAADDFSFDLDKSSEADMQSLEAELAGFSLDLEDQPKAPTADDDVLLDLDEELSKPVAGEPAAEDFDFQLSDPIQSADMPDEFDLSVPDETSGGAVSETFISEFDEVETEPEVLARDMDEPLDRPEPEAAIEVESTSEALDDDFDFFADTDETTTKLDLARAYIDMGDAEGARDILDEVMNEGSDTQQQEAREMLAKLA